MVWHTNTHRVASLNPKWGETKKGHMHVTHKYSWIISYYIPPLRHIDGHFTAPTPNLIASFVEQNFTHGIQIARCHSQTNVLVRRRTIVAISSQICRHMLDTNGWIVNAKALGMTPAYGRSSTNHPIHWTA